MPETQDTPQPIRTLKDIQAEWSALIGTYGMMTFQVTQLQDRLATLQSKLEELNTEHQAAFMADQLATAQATGEV